MQYLPEKTLAFWLSVPQVKNHDLSFVLSSNMGASTLKYWKEKESDQANPDSSALYFYALNQMTMTIRNKFTLHETLPDWANDIMDRYTKRLVFDGERLLHYLFLVCTREARHATKMSKPAGFWGEFGEYQVQLEKFYKSLDGDTGSLTSGAAHDFAVNQLAVPITMYMRVAVKLFNGLSWGGGYGGKPWGQIAQTCLAFLEGKTSMEMMIDTAWTLAHNNGPMFNKGMLYTMYSDALKTLLDVQRSGQVCELVVDEVNVIMKFPGELKTLVSKFKEHCPDVIGDYVDWEKVESLGALHKYSTYKSKQAAAKPKPVVPVIVNGKQIKITGEYWVTSTESVPTFERMGVA